MAALASLATAQTATGVLTGTVTDSTGAVVAGAKVTTLNTKTGVSPTTVTNPQGVFLQPYLIPGDYQVTVEMTGFDRHVTSDIRLSVQQTIELQVTLKVGEVATKVEVSAAGAQLSTTTATVSTVITNKAMMDLPLNGRSAFGLAALVPGVFPGGVPLRGSLEGETHRAKSRSTAHRSSCRKTT